MNFNNLKAVCIFQRVTISNIFLTIVIPTYKRSKLLLQAVESALNQKDNGIIYDVLVVDNNPERGDETELAMERYRDNLRVSYFKNVENLGPAGNWNQLYQLAHGEWCVMLHDDDILSPDYLRVLIACMEKFSADGYLFPDFADFKGEKMPNMSEIKSALMGVSLDIRPETLARGNYLRAPLGMCLKRNFVNDIGGFDKKFYPSIDYEFYVRFSAKYRLIALFGIEIGYYRWFENDSLSPETIRNCENVDYKLISDLSIRYEKSYLLLWAYDGWRENSLIKKVFKNRISLKEKLKYILNYFKYKIFKRLRSSRRLKSKYGKSFILDIHM